MRVLHLHSDIAMNDAGMPIKKLDRCAYMPSDFIENDARWVAEGGSHQWVVCHAMMHKGDYQTLVWC